MTYFDPKYLPQGYWPTGYWPGVEEKAPEKKSRGPGVIKVREEETLRARQEEELALALLLAA